MDKMEEESSVNLNELKEALINHVSTDNKTFFKHQQKNEEEIDLKEKREIVKSILNDSHTKFLSRFGMVLKKEHLQYFESQAYDENQREFIKEQLKQLKFNLDHERVLVKNRRYAAMVKLINDKEYFSDYEMERRNPLLYNELIGKFISPVERAKRSRPNSQPNTLVDILLDQIDRDDTKEIVERQQRLECDNSRDSFGEEKSDAEDQLSLWGNFDDENKKKCNSRKRHKDLFITVGERDVLREEFLGIMYNNFLMGKDSEFFDYSTVDTNDQYDEVDERDQDCQDKYFEEESSHSIDDTKKSSENESEDELEIYMKHIEQHIKRQNEDHFQEEFDDD